MRSAVSEKWVSSLVLSPTSREPKRMISPTASRVKALRCSSRTVAATKRAYCICSSFAPGHLGAEIGLDLEHQRKLLVVEPQHVVEQGVAHDDHLGIDRDRLGTQVARC